MLPLEGVRVIDLTRVLSGPFCSMLLGDLGADVIKVEGVSKGDPVRKQGAIKDGLSWYFAAFNRNKRAIRLDLRSEAGKAVLTRLLTDADILCENFRPGVLAAMGFTPDRLTEINPRLITVSVNGYGSTGPYADRPAFDFIAQAMSGFMASNGTPESGPLRVAAPITDVIAGLYAALGAVAALRGRDAGGPAQAVEASMMMSMLSMLAFLPASQLAHGSVPAPSGNDHPISSPYGMFACKDGSLAVAPSTDPILAKFMEALDLSHLLEDPRFATMPERIANRPALTSEIEAVMMRHTQAHWLEVLNGVGVPCGRVQSMAEVLDDPQVAAQEMVLDIETQTHGTVLTTGFPLKISQTPLAVRHPPPDPGAQTDAVLRGAGYSDDEIVDLKAKGAAA